MHEAGSGGDACGHERLQGVGLQNREPQTVPLLRGCLVRVPVVVDAIQLVPSDDIHGVFCHIVNTRRFHCRLHPSPASDDAWLCDEWPEGIRLAEDDEELTILQLAGDPPEVRCGQVAEAEFLARLVVPAAVVGHLGVTAMHLPTPEAEHVARRAELVSVHPPCQLRHEAPPLNCWLLGSCDTAIKKG